MKNKFNFVEFCNPSSFYYPSYFWVWNDVMTQELLLEQLHDMYKHKALTLCPMPEPKELAPELMKTLMEPDYLTEEYFNLYKRVIKEAHRLKMCVWLYDEGGWPSGGACGKVVTSNPSLVQKVLRHKEQSFVVEQMFPPLGSRPPYPDLLNPTATKCFIKLTHQAYKKVVGKYFGSTIKGTFTDEPAYAYVIPEKQIPWTDDLRKEFRRLKGYDLAEHLPALFTEPHKIKSTKDMQVRIDFFDFLSRQFANAYVKEIKKWCHSNNLLSTGHFGGEDVILGAVKYGYGHILRVLRELDIPGIDTIWRQIFPGEINLDFPKYASSVAHQQNKRWTLTESFAVYGCGLTLEQMKWITNYQYVRGINLTVISNYPLSTKKHLMAGCRPHFGPVNPLWEYIENYHNYVARISYLLSLGKPMIKDAVYYPVRDLWAGGNQMGKKAKLNERLTKYLLEHQCDFDFIDDDVLESSSNKTIDGCLKVGSMSYQTIWISSGDWMSKKTKEKLSLFESEGGQVKKTFQSAIPLVKIRPKCNSLRICGRYLKNGSLYFLTNEGAKEIKVKVFFKETLPVYQLDPETGKCWKPSDASYTNSTCSIPIHLPFAGSCIFLFSKERISVSPAPSLPGSTLLVLNNNWQCRRVKSYEVGKNNYKIKRVNAKTVSIQLGDWRKTIGEDFSGDVEYTLRFECSEDIKKQSDLLDLGDVYYVAQVTLNGKSLGKKAWRPFVFPVRGAIKKGINKLEIIVTNTLANQLTSMKVRKDWDEKKKQGWILGPYQEMTLNFEKDSNKSGLFGPIKILSAK